MTLTEFLLARIAEDEVVARYEVVHMKADDPNRPTYHDGSMIGQYGRVKMSKDEYADFLRATFPTTIETPNLRLWVECEAKRLLIQRAESLVEYVNGTREDSTHTYERTLTRLLAPLALPYVNHPDYLPEWKV